MDSHSTMVLASRPFGKDIQLTSSELLQLPGEMRNRVYDFVFADLSSKTTNIVFRHTHGAST